VSGSCERGRRTGVISLLLFCVCEDALHVRISRVWVFKVSFLKGKQIQRFDTRVKRANERHLKKPGFLSVTAEASLVQCMMDDGIKVYLPFHLTAKVCLFLYNYMSHFPSLPNALIYEISSTPPSYRPPSFHPPRHHYRLGVPSWPTALPPHATPWAPPDATPWSGHWHH